MFVFFVTRLDTDEAGRRTDNFILISSIEWVYMYSLVCYCFLDTLTNHHESLGAGAVDMPTIPRAFAAKD